MGEVLPVGAAGTATAGLVLGGAGDVPLPLPPVSVTPDRSFP